MNLIVLLIFGALVGWLASILVKTNASQGLLGDIILGVIGAWVGGFIMNFFGQPGVTGFNIYSLLVGILGAVVFVVIGRAITRAL